MEFIAKINIMPLKSLLDPQGKAVGSNMKNIGLSEIKEVRVGKHITLNIVASNKEEAVHIVDQACKKILCNQIMESYEFSINKM